MSDLSELDVQMQSRQAYGQWCVQWRENARYHGERCAMDDFSDLHGIGFGRAALCIANGSSFETEIETIKKHAHNVDIIACDKTLGHCLDHGITPKFVILCDANVNFDRYCAKWADKLQDTILVSNVCAATKWATIPNWKKVYFFTLKDVLKSELEFSALSGCKNIMVAGTNVSNSMVIFLTQCDNHINQNFFGYDKILLIGFDYCWDERYYAFSEDGDGKKLS